MFGNKIYCNMVGQEDSGCTDVLLPDSDVEFPKSSRSCDFPSGFLTKSDRSKRDSRFDQSSSSRYLPNNSSVGGGGGGGGGGGVDMVPPRGGTAPGAGPAPALPQTQLCMKVFVQRDYSDGTTVKFQTSFPPELEGKLDRASFEYTISQLNAYFAEAEKGSCSTYCEGCMACLTAYLMYICTQTHYEKCLRKVAKFIVEQNERVYKPRGLLLTSPVERGLRVIEISILDQPMVART